MATKLSFPIDHPHLNNATSTTTSTGSQTRSAPSLLKSEILYPNNKLNPSVPPPLARSTWFPFPSTAKKNHRSRRRSKCRLSPSFAWTSKARERLMGGRWGGKLEFSSPRFSTNARSASGSCSLGIRSASVQRKWVRRLGRCYRGWKLECGSEIGKKVIGRRKKIRCFGVWW